MGLLDKFSNVEIKADRRISEEDKEFCVKHQEAFDKSRPALQKIIDLMSDAIEEQRNILPSEDGNFGNFYMNGREFNCDDSGIRCIYDVMEKRNQKFINSIVYYFSKKYHVELDADEIGKHIIPKEPEEPRVPYGGYSRMTDEKQDTFESKFNAYKEAQAAYKDVIRNLPLRYEQIVDEIFTQMGGFSFEEQAMNEFLERTWNCCHNTWSGQNPESFEIKGDILRLPRGCYCDENKWMSHPVPEYKPSDNMKTLIDAIVYYECGRMNDGRLWLPDLFDYRGIKTNMIHTVTMEKIESIRFFKNGRVDIRFRDAMYVQEFAEKYLRRRSL